MVIGETKEELLSGLRYVKNQIEKIIAMTNRQVEIVANFREEQHKLEKQATLEFEDKKGKLKIAVLVMYVAYLLLCVFMGPIGWIDDVFAIILGVIIYKRKDRKSKLKTICVVLLGIDIVFAIFNILINGKPLLKVLMILFVLLSVAIVFVYIKAKNNKIEKQNIAIEQQNAMIDEANTQTAEYNAEVQRQYDETVEQLEIMKNELYTESGSWYPKDYYFLEAASFFLSAVENFKADSIKEAVLLFDDTQHKNEILASQKALEELSQQQMIKQAEITKQLKFANVMSIANIALQGATIGAINSQTSAINSAIGSQTSSINSAINNQTENIGKAIGNASDKIIRKLRK